MSAWIDVNDELPEESGVYLCHFSDGDIETFAMENDYSIWGVSDIHVTHWMPLPEPPKE